MIVEKENEIANYMERMLKENEIASLLSFYTMQFDGKTQYWHDISGKQSLQDYLVQEEISIDLIERIFTYIAMALEELQRFLIHQSCILLRPDAIYISRKNQFQLYLCFCPGVQNQEEHTGYTLIVENILNNVDTGKEELTKICFELYELTLQDGMTLKEMQRFIQSKKQIEIPIVEENKEISIMETPVNVVPETRDGLYACHMNSEEDVSDNRKWIDIRQKIIDKGQKILSIILGWEKENYIEDSKEDFIFDPEPEKVESTRLLFQVKVCEGKLIYQGAQREENYEVTTAVFRIGHAREGNEAYLRSSAVSRFHARIKKEDNSYYIEDLNSTNGTYVNGEALSYTQSKKLEPMDRIQFGDVPYLFM